jgi:hypothetical protein
MGNVASMVLLIGLLYSSFNQALAGQAELSLVASESGFKVFLATEKLKLHVLAQRSITA